MHIIVTVNTVTGTKVIHAENLMGSERPLSFPHGCGSRHETLEPGKHMHKFWGNR